MPRRPQWAGLLRSPLPYAWRHAEPSADPCCLGDVLLGHSTQVSASAAKAIFDEYAAGLQQAETRRTAASADSVLAANKAKEGVKVTESGLQYRVLRAAQGTRPMAQDTVVVHYKGTLPREGVRQLLQAW